MKTMAIRLEDDLHAQLNVIATLEEQTITDIIRASIIAYIEARKDALASKAEAALEEIERDADARRKAIADLFGSASSTPADEPAASGEPEAAPSRPTRGQKGGTIS